jgi:hypothetical protein
MWTTGLRDEFVSSIRPYYDAPDVEVPVQFYFAPPNAKRFPLRNGFRNPWYVHTPRFRPQVGFTRKYEPNNNGNINGAKGIGYCGTQQQWLFGCSINDPVTCQCPREDVLPVQETPAGVVDGVNRVFTLTYQPITPQSCLVWVNGVQQLQGGNYTLAGQRITFSPASTPRVPCNLAVYYLRQN